MKKLLLLLFIPLAICSANEEDEKIIKRSAALRPFIHPGEYALLLSGRGRNPEAAPLHVHHTFPGEHVFIDLPIEIILDHPPESFQKKENSNKVNKKDPEKFIEKLKSMKAPDDHILYTITREAIPTTKGEPFYFYYSLYKNNGEKSCLLREDTDEKFRDPVKISSCKENELDVEFNLGFIISKRKIVRFLESPEGIVLESRKADPFTNESEPLSKKLLETMYHVHRSTDVKPTKKES